MRRSASLVGFVVALVVVSTASATSRSEPATPKSLPSMAGRELTPHEQAVHVLSRLAFGPRPGDVEHVMRIGVDRWIDQQLHPEKLPDRDAEKVLASYPVLAQSADELIRAYPPPQQLRRLARRDSMTRDDSLQLRRAQQQNRLFAGEIVSSKVAQAVVSERQLQEVMTDFWENHFTVFIGKGQQIRYFLPEYDRETIRPHVLGHFRDLLGAVAKSPAMLFYLDNAQSVADSGRPTLEPIRGGRAARGGIFNPRRPGVARRPGARLPGGRGQLPPEIRDRIARGDTVGLRARAQELMQQLQQRRPRGLNENYGRELLELHTLGVDGGYTQKDVIEVARALTGWTIQPPRSGRSGFLFRPEVHDAGEKMVLGHALKAGRGIEDGEEVLDIIARHPSTARFIARKLCIRFVSDTPPASLVERAAATFTRTDGDIREVVRTIVTSSEFFSKAAFHSKVKSPFEVTVSALRAIGAQPDTTPRTAGIVAFLGQPVFGHQAPNGWPETGEAWMNTGAILNRINFGLAVAAGRLPGASLSGWPMYDSLANAPRDVQVDGVINSLLGGRASSETREILRSGSNPMVARAAADTSMFAGDAPAMGDRGSGPPPRGQAGGFRPGLPGRGGGAASLGQVPQLSGLAQVVGLALGSPEFQRR
jgi:uncharacterized protein (DUF1800 family)